MADLYLDHDASKKLLQQELLSFVQGVWATHQLGRQAAEDYDQLLFAAIDSPKRRSVQ